MIEHIEENFFAVCRYWGTLNNSLKEVDSITAMSTGVPVSDINWVCNAKPLNHASVERVEAIKKYYETLKIRFWWWVYPCGRSTETIKILQDKGFRLYAKVSCMAAQVNNRFIDYKRSDEIIICPVASKNDLLVWKDISFDGFEMPARAQDTYSAFVLSFKLDACSPQKLFLAYLDGKPVATSLLFTHKNTAGIYYVSTLPAYRNKGCGIKITQAAMQAAKESGFKDIILQATPMGERIYKKIGFEEYCQAEICKLNQ